MHRFIPKYLAIIAILGAVLSVVSVTEAGRTIKKNGAVLRRPVSSQSSAEDDKIQTPEGKSDLVLKETNSTVSESQETCSEGHCVEKKRNTKSTTHKGAPARKRIPHPHYQQQRPPSMYEIYWRNRFRNGSTPYQTTNRILPYLQRAALDMARGILSGMGWDIQGWELSLLESIVRTVSKDMLSVLHLFF